MAMDWAGVLMFVVLSWLAGSIAYIGISHDMRKDKLANCRYHSWEYVPGKGMICSRCTRVAGENL